MSLAPTTADTTAVVRTSHCSSTVTTIVTHPVVISAFAVGRAVVPTVPAVVPSAQVEPAVGRVSEAGEQRGVADLDADGIKAREARETFVQTVVRLQTTPVSSFAGATISQGVRLW